MEEHAAVAHAALGVLADLAPSGQDRAGAGSIPTEWFRWLPVDAVHLFGPADPEVQTAMVGGRGLAALETSVKLSVPIDREYAERLAAVDQIRPEQRSLRVGWLFLAGPAYDSGGRPRRILQPLVTIPVRARHGFLVGLGVGGQLAPAGDVELTPLVTDVDARRELEQAIEIGGGYLHGLHDVALPPQLLARLDRLRHFATRVTAAAGLRATRLVPATGSPDQLRGLTELVVVAGVAVYATHGTTILSRSGSLRAWKPEQLDTQTAFHALYADMPAPDAADEPAADPESPYVLTPTQRAAVRRSRRAPVTVVSGPPGTGKSHTVVAIACDALARGESVLVAARSDATVDALLDLFERVRGLEPVVFGSNERRVALADRLSGGQLSPVPDGAVAFARRALADAVSRRERSRTSIAALLRAEELVAGATPDAFAVARAVAPGLFDPGADLDQAAALLVVCAAPARGWWARRGLRSARRRLDRLTGSAGQRHDEVRAALDVARAARAVAELRAGGGLQLGDAWAELAAADDEVRRLAGAALAADLRAARRIGGGRLPVLGALATALRSGRGARRAQLARLDARQLTEALPLWVGGLPDVDDLLPQIAGAFDLVVLDEASSIEQPLAAPALLRGRRAVVVGDPRQLRHVSFVGDDELARAVEAHGLTGSPSLAARLDVRRNSAFDVAAAVAPVLTLDEHFRSDPHLVAFVFERLYGGRIELATRTPLTESSDRVDVVRLDGRRNRVGAVPAEVDWVVQTLRSLREAGAGSVGVVTPFRAQADAIEHAVLAAFTADDLTALDLRVGTVHGFQGNERDVVLASLGVDADSGPAPWRFAEDPHLLAVFLTRARRRLVLALSAEPPAGGLLAAYVARAEAPPRRAAGEPASDPWTAALAADLRAAGLPVVTCYPAGRHRIDVCVEGRFCPVAVECAVHPDGADAHVDRHLDLRRAGWTMLDAYRSRWSDRRAELVVHLLGQLPVPSSRGAQSPS